MNLGFKTFRFDILDSGPGVTDYLGVNDDVFSGYIANTNNNHV